MNKSSMALALAAALGLAAASAHAQARGDRRTEGAKTGKQAKHQAELERWPEKSRQAAQAMIEKYGEPDGMTDRMLVWHDEGNFHRIMVHRDAVEYNFPAPHEAVLEHTIRYDVPVERVGELARFDASISVDRAAGLVSSRGDTEASNLIALNLAREVIEGRRSAPASRTRRCSRRAAGKALSRGSSNSSSSSGSPGSSSAADRDGFQTTGRLDRAGRSLLVESSHVASCKLHQASGWKTRPGSSR